MNESNIESLLRKAPTIKAPAGLLETLQGDISLAASRSLRAESQFVSGTSWAALLKRWLPAGAYVLCVMIAAAMVQTQLQINHLRTENERLRDALKNLPAARELNAEHELLQRQNQQLSRLEKDNQELHTLRAEAEKLRAALQDVELIRAENQRLQARAGTAPGAEDFFAQLKEQKDKAQAAACINNMKQVLLAARMAANEDKSDNLPKDFASMTNQLPHLSILICPADPAFNSHPKKSITDVENSNPQYRYEMVTPGASLARPNTVYIRCPFHQHIGLADGSVQSKIPSNFEINADNELQQKKESN